QYNCELAEQSIEKGYVNEALQYLKRAQAIDHDCVRASMIRGRLESDAGRYKEAIRYYKRIIAQDPDYISEIVSPLAECYRKLNEEDKLVKFLEECLETHPRISLALMISGYLQRHQGEKAAIEFIAQQIQRQPSLRGLSY